VCNGANYEALQEETVKSWDQIISEEVVYALQPVNSNLKVSNCIRHFDWVAKYYTGAFDIHLKFGLLGQRNVYFKSILSVAPPSVRDAGSNSHAVVEGGNGHHSMLVDVAELVELPERMVPIRTLVRLKRFDDCESGRGNVSDFVPVALIGRERRLRFDGKSRQSPWFIRSEQCKLPRQMVQTGAESIGEFADKHPYSVGRDSLFNLDTVPRMLNIILSSEEIGVVPKLLDFPLEFIEASAPPTKFHLRISQPNAHMANDSRLKA
jgi:hypothetical protein